MPNSRYPSSAPICIGAIQAELFTMLNPAPPFSTGVAKYAGTQVNRPQYAKSTRLDIPMATTV